MEKEALEIGKWYQWFRRIAFEHLKGEEAAKEIDKIEKYIELLKEEEKRR